MAQNALLFLLQWAEKKPSKKLEIKNSKNLFHIDCIFMYVEGFDLFHLDLLCKSYGQSCF